MNPRRAQGARRLAAPRASGWVLAAGLLLAVPGARAAMASPVVDAGLTAVVDATPALAASAATSHAETPPAIPAVAPATGEAPDASDDPRDSMLTALVRMVLVLAGILLLAYLILHKGMGSLSAKLAQGRLVRVVDRIGLEARKSLYVVEIAGRYYLIGTTDHGVSCLATLDAEADRAAFEDALHARRGGAGGGRAGTAPGAPPPATGTGSEGDRHG